MKSKSAWIRSNKNIIEKNHCYLGIAFCLSGSLNKTNAELRKKSLRAYFSLKSSIDIRSLAVKSLFRLFCQIWIFGTALIKLMVSKNLFMNPSVSFSKTTLNLSI